MISIHSTLITVLLGLWLAIVGQCAVVPDTLVLYDDKITTLDSYTSFFEDLKEREFILEFDTYKDDVLLYSANQKLFTNLIIFPTKQRSLGAGLKAAKLLDFVSDGGNIFVVTSPSGLSDEVRSFVNELGIYPSPKNYKVIDHFNYDSTSSPDTHDVLKLDSSSLLNSFVTEKVDGSIFYQGSAALLGNGQLIVPILNAPKTSYTSDDVVNSLNDDHTWTFGDQGYLIAGFQARNNARVTWIGSDYFLSNESFEKYKSNQQVVKDITKWTFQEKGVVKVTHVDHYHAENPQSNATYKIKDDIVYEIGISEWDGEVWKPYKASDIQLEFTMLDPYQRLYLKSAGEKEESEVYSVQFKIPDQHGMFSFITNYKRSGLSFIEEKNVVTVRHLANDEYPRSWDITNSWVYITSFLSVVIAWVFFVILFLYTGNVKTVSKTKKDS